MCDVLEKLEEIIVSRIKEGNPNSYTYRLYSAGPAEIVKKVGEEAVEVAVAALAQGPKRVVEESADLIYHLLVLLAAQGVKFQDVCEELRRRMR